MFLILSEENSANLPEVPLVQYVKFKPRTLTVDLSLKNVYTGVVYNQGSTGLELMIPL